MKGRKTNFRLTLKTARALIKQELNLHGNLTVERAGDGVYIYVMQQGNFEITVSNDWYERNGRISLTVMHRFAGTVQMYFDPDTLEEDGEAEDKYRRDVREEWCEGCRYREGARE